MTQGIDDTGMPDDPRAVCDAIIDELRRGEDWPTHSFALDFARMVDGLCAGRDEDFASAKEGLRIMATQAIGSAKLHNEVWNNVFDLASHGTGKFARIGGSAS